MSIVMRKSPQTPKEWIKDLSAMGFTHLLINPGMLEIWETEQWNDPLITAFRVVDAAERWAKPQGPPLPWLRLYRLNP